MNGCVSNLRQLYSYQFDMGAASKRHQDSRLIDRLPKYGKWCIEGRVSGPWVAQYISIECSDASFPGSLARRAIVPFDPNSTLLFGTVLLGGFSSGEATRCLVGLPRTTGHLVLGLAVGRSGFEWTDSYVIDSARFFIASVLGLILFELGHRVPADLASLRRSVVAVGLAESAVTYALIAQLGWRSASR